MERIAQSRVASVLTIIAGLWMLVTPAFIAMPSGAVVSIMITGGIIALLGLIQVFWMNALPSWINIIAAVWLFISAFMFGISTGAAWNQVVFAIIAFVLAIWDGVEVSDVQRHSTTAHPAH